jgi:outer membrane protein TolC
MSLSCRVESPRAFLPHSLRAHTHFHRRWAHRRCLEWRPVMSASVATLALSVAAAVAAQSPLTLSDAQRLAVQRSHQLSAQDAAVTAAREMVIAAGQLPDPVATLGVNNLPINGPDQFSLTRDFMTMTSIGVTQEFTRADKRLARAERYEREADEAIAAKAASVAAIERDSALAWLDRYYAEATQLVIDGQRRQAQEEIDAAESAYRVGRGTLADLLAARGALALLQDRASEVAQRLRAAKIALSRWVGDDATLPLGGAPAIDAIRLDAGTLETTLDHHADLAVLARKEDVAAAEVRVAQANKRPDWSVAVMYSQRGAAYSNMVSVNVSVPIQWDQTNRQDRDVATKLARLDQARAERADMLQTHVAEVRTMIEEWKNDRDRRAQYERDVLPLAAERMQAVMGAYRGGRVAITEVLIARRNEIDTRLQALKLDADSARLWAQLNFLVPEGDAEAHAGVAHAKDAP